MKSFLKAGFVLLFFGVALRLLLSTQSLDVNEALLKRLMRPYAIVFLSLFNNMLTPVILAGLMVTTALAISAYLVLRTHNIILLIHNTTSRIESLCNNNGWRDITPQARADKLLRAFLPTPRAHRNMLLYSSVLGTQATRPRVSEYLSLHSFDEGRPTLGFLARSGTYFIGLGLIFTFMGLVAGLYHAGAGMKLGNVEAARDSLILLLNAAAFKFLTSIAGVASALAITLTADIRADEIENSLVTLCDAVDGLSSSLQIESPSSRHLASLEGNLAHMTRQLDVIVGAMAAMPLEQDKA